MDAEPVHIIAMSEDGSPMKPYCELTDEERERCMALRNMFAATCNACQQSFRVIDVDTGTVEEL